jgi:hypothetical protein
MCKYNAIAQVESLRQETVESSGFYRIPEAGFLNRFQPPISTSFPPMSEPGTDAGTRLPFPVRFLTPVLTSLVDDLAYRLSRFLIFLFVSQDSFAIPSIQDSCLKKQIWTFLWYSCRQNLV